MAPAKGKKKATITVEVKKEIIGRREGGARVADLARLYRRPASTICCILKRKEALKGLDAAKGVTRLSKQRPRALEEVEKRLLAWIGRQQRAGAAVSEGSICAEARALYAELAGLPPGASAEGGGGFKASRGWFDNFKRRSGIQSVARPGDAAGGPEARAAGGRAPRSRELLLSERRLPRQTLHGDQTALSWKKMPRRTYVTAGGDEAAPPGEAAGPEAGEEGAPGPAEERGRDLTTDELTGLRLQQQDGVPGESPSEEEEEGQAEGSLASSEIREMCRMWETVQRFVGRHHPNQAAAVRATNLFNDRAMSHFCEILKRRQTRRSLERFLVKVAGKENGPSQPWDSSDSFRGRHPPTQ